MRNAVLLLAPICRWDMAVVRERDLGGQKVRACWESGVGMCWGCVAYLRPSFLYPAALAYQLAAGMTMLASQGRRRMKGARE